MNIVLWARVSSREQREGYSIDAQLRAMRDRAAKSGWTVLKEFVVAESAKRGADRVAFNAMLKWVRSNARRERIGAILAHKLDRVCRNMRDAVRLQELEDEHNVRLLFVDNEFGPGAAGALSFNVMAAVAQYYSDNLRTEVLKGMDEKVRQGWPTGAAPYGYMNTDDRDEPVQPDPVRSRTIVRIFELYATGRHTFASLTHQLEAEGHVYRPSQRRFTRTSLSYILNNRFYIGEIWRNGAAHEGRYRRLIDRRTFDECQRILNGKNRRSRRRDHALASGLFRCSCCGRSMTGERIRRRLRGGGVREHVYYRCANNSRGDDHPVVRWREADLENAIVADLDRLRLPVGEIADWFREALAAAFGELDEHRSRQATSLRKRQTELANMQDRLLNTYLAGSIPEDTFRTKQEELATEARGVQESLDRLGDDPGDRGGAAVAVFDWCQQAGRIWRGSNNADRRAILEAVCLNRDVGPTSLALTKRKPFDVLAEGLDSRESRGDRIRTCGLLVPNQALYQAELRPAGDRGPAACGDRRSVVQARQTRVRAACRRSVGRTSIPGGRRRPARMSARPSDVRRHHPPRSPPTGAVPSRRTLGRSAAAGPRRSCDRRTPSSITRAGRRRSTSAGPAD